LILLDASGWIDLGVVGRIDLVGLDEVLVSDLNFGRVLFIIQRILLNYSFGGRFLDQLLERSRMYSINVRSDFERKGDLRVLEAILYVLGSLKSIGG